jgi:predicted Zn-dependent peptidase
MRYTVTYVREVTQQVDAVTLADAAEFAARYAHEHRLTVLTIYPGVTPRPDPRVPA